jgi:hypothetical protein
MIDLVSGMPAPQFRDEPEADTGMLPQVGHFPNYNQVIIRHSAIHAALYRDMK